MTSVGKFTLRLAIYGLVLAYLAGDLFVFHGPLRRRLDLADPDSAAAVAEARRTGVVATVFNHKITMDQLDRAVRERLWLDGRKVGDLTPEDLRLIRYVALNELIDHELLRVKAKANAPDLIVTDEEVDERLRRLASRFESRDAMEKSMKSQGIADESELRERIAARIQQERYVESKVAPLCEVKEEEARSWFSEHRKELEIPGRIEVRHVFLATLDKEPGEVKTKLEAALADLKADKKSFADLAAELSEDAASKPRGGRLGWITRDRLSADFTAPVFALDENEPALVRTKLGWHLVEVTGRKPARARGFDDARDEIVAALEAAKRRQAVADYREALRKFEAAKIRIDHGMLADDPADR